MVDAELVVFSDAVGHLGVTTDQRGARATPDQAVSSPQVGRDLETGRASVVQGHHPLLANGIAASEDLLRRVDPLRRQACQEPLRLRPRVGRGVTTDDVQSDAELQLAPVSRGAGPDPVESIGNLSWGLTPRQISVDVLRRHLLGR